MQMEKERDSVKQINHEFHEHPLVFVEELSNKRGKAYCSGCREVVSGPCFSCSECRYQLHQKCAEAPSEILHPLHRRHSSGLFLRGGPNKHHEGYACAFCEEKRDMFFYECQACWFALDISCALSSYNIADEKCHEFHHDAHRHSLTCIENLENELSRVHCSLCHQPLAHAVYICLDCLQFHVHKKCLDELPTKISHPSHRIHPLILNKDDSLFCKFCQKKHDGYFYHCSPCNLSINFECVWPKPIIVEDKYHQHPFTLLWRQEKDSFLCDACSGEGSFVSYICTTCNVVVHEGCTSLPRLLKITRHDHAISHSYFLQKQELERQNCRICLSEVKLERGSYHCSKQGCNFIVHVNCALEKDYLYYVIDHDQEDQDDEYLNHESSISCVIERNEDGEATKIKHFSHDHELTLGNKIELEDGDKLCDGCMVSISSTWYYSCSQCEFLLHKTCAELPRKKHLWFHLSLATLIPSVDLFQCYQCDCYSSGFVYKSEYGEFCLRCARTSHTFSFTSQGHKHFLFFDFNFRGECNGCGKSCSDGAFKCRDCSSAFDFRCMTLPETTRHKCDKHSLTLAFHEENDDPEQHCCHVCEQDRDPKLWFYYCAICDNAAHPKCVLGEFSFVKMGVNIFVFTL